MSDVAVRELVAADAQGIAGAVRAGREHGELRASSDAEGAFVLKAFEVDPALFGGAFAAGELIGLVSPEFKVTLVAPPFRRRGPDRQGRGLGRQLLRAGVARLRSLGIREIDLSVNARNEHALRLYEEEGFVRTRTRERWARPVPPTNPPPEATRP